MGLKVVYVAGPYRAENNWEIEQNIRRAEEAAHKIWLSGKAAAICPHCETRYFQGSAPDVVWLEGTLELLRRCDAALFLPGWEDSVGACGEYEEATTYSIPRFTTLPDVFHWLDDITRFEEHNRLNHAKGAGSGIEEVDPQSDQEESEA